jgi:hypothetical protein
MIRQAILIAAIVVAAGACSSSTVRTQHSPSVSSQSKSSTTSAAAVYPPTTLAEVRSFAATGDASQIHEFSSDSRGLPSCPTPNIYATVAPTLTGRQLAADALAFFVQHSLLGAQCQAALFLFHGKAENTGSGYTAGRVFLDVNPSGPKHNLEVDTGGLGSQSSFDLNF